MPVKNREVEQDSLTPQNLVTLLNKAYKDKVQLEFVKLSGDTIFVAIPESTILARQMGSTGADGYLATATFTLTELEGITHVNFDFEEGDHARPGVYNRQLYLNRKRGNVNE